MSRRNRRRRARKSADQAALIMEEEVAKRFRFTADVLKVDAELGIVFGWGVICKEDGEDYFDVQGDNADENGLIEASADFMEHSRVTKEMHRGGERGGGVVFAFPLTTDIAKAFGIVTDTTGLMIGIRPDTEMLEKFKSGELRGFSIGGIRLEDEEVPE